MATLPAANYKAADMILRELGYQASPVRRKILAAWIAGEKPAGQPFQHNNPLNTTRNDGSTYDWGSQGNIAGFPTPQAGVHANVLTIKQSNFNRLRAALASGNPNAFGQALASEPWGTSSQHWSQIFRGAGGALPPVSGPTAPAVTAPKGPKVAPAPAAAATTPAGTPGATAVDPGSGLTYQPPVVNWAKISPILKAAGEQALAGQAPTNLTAQLLKAIAPGGLVTGPTLPGAVGLGLPGGTTTPTTPRKPGVGAPDVRAPGAGAGAGVPGPAGGGNKFGTPFGTTFTLPPLPAEVRPVSATSTIRNPKGQAVPIVSSYHGGKPVSAWWASILDFARSKGWKGTVQSGYRSVQEQAALAARNPNRALVASPGGSPHNYGMAVDISDGGEFQKIVTRYKLPVWRYAAEGWHFEPQGFRTNGTETGRGGKFGPAKYGSAL